MEKHELEPVAAALAEAADRLKHANIVDAGNVNAFLKDVGADLDKVVAALRA